jgi:hypothetical protein
LTDVLALFQEVGVQQLFALASAILAEVAYDQGDDARAVVLMEKSATLLREVGDKQSLAYALGIFGTIAHARGDNEQALALLEESLVLQREAGVKWGMAAVINRLGMVEQSQGNDSRATALYEESLTLCRELGDKHGLAECLEGLAGVAIAQQHLEYAARLLGAAAVWREAIGAPLSPREQTRYDRDMSAVRADLDEAALAAAWATGQVAPLDQVITHS